MLAKLQDLLTTPPTDAEFESAREGNSRPYRLYVKGIISEKEFARLHRQKLTFTVNFTTEEIELLRGLLHEAQVDDFSPDSPFERLLRKIPTV